METINKQRAIAFSRLEKKLHRACMESDIDYEEMIYALITTWVGFEGVHADLGGAKALRGLLLPTLMSVALPSPENDEPPQAA
jgi:hypothetical protein